MFSFLREELASVWKEAGFLLHLIFGLSLQHPVASYSREAPPPRLSSGPLSSWAAAGWPVPEPYLVVELPPAPETQLQEFACVPLDDFQADSAKRNPGLCGLKCRRQGLASWTAQG